MKTTIIISVLISLSLIVNAQFSLKYETHALQGGYSHITQYVENVSPGAGGENQIWDFSDFDCSNSNISEIYDTDETLEGDKFPNTNICVMDDNSYFYFDINKNTNEYWGLVTENAVITFDNPIIKMVYPFSYNDKVTGEFSGTGLYYGQIISDIYGEYTIEADAYGTLLLPNNVSVDNVLRVKSINHIYETACKTTEFYNEKYLWYAEDYRYPIMVVVINKKVVNGEETISNYGYYNEKAFIAQVEQSNSKTAEYSVTVYPNPFAETVNISYYLENETKVNIDIYNETGIKVENLVSDENQKGQFVYKFSPDKKSLAVGTYFVRISFNDKTITKKIVMID